MMMIVRLLIVIILHVVLPEVSSEVKEGVIGGSVLLPCSGSKDQYAVADINVSWRHNEGFIVYDIIEGVESLKNQDSMYKSRTVTFSKEYSKGNFSLQLNNLQEGDAGTYTCFIIKEVNLEVELLIKAGNRQNNSTLPSTTEKPNDNKKSNKGTQTGPEKIVTIALLAISILI